LLHPVDRVSLMIICFAAKSGGERMVGQRVMGVLIDFVIVLDMPPKEEEETKAPIQSRHEKKKKYQIKKKKEQKKKRKEEKKEIPKTIVFSPEIEREFLEYKLSAFKAQSYDATELRTIKTLFFFGNTDAPIYAWDICSTYPAVMDREAIALDLLERGLKTVEPYIKRRPGMQCAGNPLCPGKVTTAAGHGSRRFVDFIVHSSPLSIDTIKRLPFNGLCTYELYCGRGKCANAITKRLQAVISPEKKMYYERLGQCSMCRQIGKHVRKCTRCQIAYFCDMCAKVCEKQCVCVCVCESVSVT
jgi:hypothetical protein